MNITIIGGEGYVGCAAAIELACAGYEVVCFGLQDKPSDWASWIDPEASVKFLVGDIRDASAVAQAVEGADVVVHLAAVVGGPACQKRPDAARTIAIDGTENLLGAAADRPVIFTSSDAVYSDRVQGLSDEDAELGPVSLYGELKLQSEQLVRQADDSVILRLSSCFGPGPRMREDLLVHCLVREHSKGGLEVQEADSIRSLLHVRDAAISIRKVIENIDRASGQTFNVASGAWTKREIAKAIEDVFGGRVTTTNQPRPDGTAKRNFRLDCTKLRSLGWAPSSDLVSGLKELR